VGAVSLCGMDSDWVAFLRADVEWFCGELVALAPAVRLRLVTELRAALDAVTTAALTAGMAAAQQEGWGLRRITTFTAVSHEQVRWLLAATSSSSNSSAEGRGAARPDDSPGEPRCGSWDDDRDGAARAARLAAYRTQGVEGGRGCP
jgi:hypothetical protein